MIVRRTHVRRNRSATCSVRSVVVAMALVSLFLATPAYAQLDGFNPAPNGLVYAIAVQPDGKILVAGAFSTLGGGGSGTTARSRIGRLHADGALDLTFNPGANDVIYSMALQPDGKTVVGGPFTGLGGTNGSVARSHIGRVNADGSLDAGFDPGTDANVYSLLVQPDGKIVVGGLFSRLGGGSTGTTFRTRIGRLNSDGSLDLSFNPGVSPAPGTVGNVLALALLPDGKIIAGECSRVWVVEPASRHGTISHGSTRWNDRRDLQPRRRRIRSNARAAVRRPRLRRRLFQHARRRDAALHRQDQRGRLARFQLRSRRERACLCNGSSGRRRADRGRKLQLSRGRVSAGDRTPGQ